jgi:sugar-specific transcriptional regulator TrmB
MFESLAGLANDSAALAKNADDNLNLFRRARKQRKEGKESLNRIKQLRVVAQDVHLALQKRESQLRERADRYGNEADGGKKDLDLRENEEILVWKNIAGIVERCRKLLRRMRLELLEWDNENEPGLWQTARMKFKLKFVQKDKLRSLHADLDEQFKALQVNLHLIHV